MMQIYEKFPRLASNNVSQRIKTYNTDRKVCIFALSKEEVALFGLRHHEIN